jgi:hypothetical protein
MIISFSPQSWEEKLLYDRPFDILIRVFMMQILQTATRTLENQCIPSFRRKPESGTC